MSSTNFDLEVQTSRLYTNVPYYYIRYNTGPLYSLVTVSIILAFFAFVSVAKVIIAVSGHKVPPD